MINNIEYDDNRYLFAVFDGMGGVENGEIASLFAAQQMNDLFSRLLEEEDLSNNKFSNMLLDMKKRVELETRAEMDENQSDQPGTTCCGFLIDHNMVRPFWIGDSRLYLLRDNQLMIISKDHTVAQEKIDYGIITPEEAVTISGWHCITKFIGDNQNSFSIGELFQIQSGDKYLLCTDGISDKFKPDDIALYMTESLETSIEHINEEIKLESKDNATAIIIEMVSKKEKQDLKDVIKEKAMDYITLVGERARVRKL